MKLLSFELWGDYAHFKKYYTTTSPLTFEFPPPPTIAGIISAIIGVDKNEYLKYFAKDKFKLSICLVNPVKKVRWTQNLIDTKKHFWRINNRTQIRTEFLKDSYFKIFFHHEDKTIFNDLKRRLESHESYYSVSLGLSELLANYRYTGEVSCDESFSEEWISIDSVIPVSKLTDDNAIKFEDDVELFKVNFPVHMKPDREVSQREDVIFERNAKPIICMVDRYFKTDRGEQIVFF